jgi:hypothetical protein
MSLRPKALARAAFRLIGCGSGKFFQNEAKDSKTGDTEEYIGLRNLTAQVEHFTSNILSAFKKLHNILPFPSHLRPSLLELVAPIDSASCQLRFGRSA